MIVKCVDNYNKENLITEGKEYLVKSSGIGKYVIINDIEEISCIDKRRFKIIKD